MSAIDWLLDFERATGGSAAVREARRTGEGYRRPDGRWLLDRVHPGRVHFPLEGGRWNTLRALRVLKWWEGAAH